MKNRTLPWLALALCMFAADTLYAQSDTRSRREEIERLIDAAPDQAGVSNPTDRFPFSERAADFVPADLGTSRDFLWDVGAWLRATHSAFDTQLNTDRTLQDYDLRFWGEASYGVVSAYARVRSLYARYENGDSPDGNDTNWQNFRVDQAYVTVDLGRALELDGTQSFQAIAGRQFMALGSGMAFANVVEGLRAEYRSGDMSVTGLVASTIHYSPDFDGSIPEDKNESDRLFLGGQVSTNSLFTSFNANVYAYFLAQIDKNGHVQGAQRYDYDSYYFGVGKQMAHDWVGLKPNEISTRGELMLQSGRSIARGTSQSETIMAYGLLADVYWLPGDRLPIKTKNVFSYYFGSGDADRLDQHSTAGGNLAGTDDSALNYFGFVSTGYALAPKLTNLHMVRFNSETSFFEDRSDAWLRSLKVGTSAFFFWKHHTNATITDFTSSEKSRFVGFELDAYADLQVSSDLDVGLRYGVFFPGSAYLFDDSRNFFSAYLNFSF